MLFILFSIARKKIAFMAINFARLPIAVIAMMKCEMRERCSRLFVLALFCGQLSDSAVTKWWWPSVTHSAPHAHILVAGHVTQHAPHRYRRDAARCLGAHTLQFHFFFTDLLGVGCSGVVAAVAVAVAAVSVACGGVTRRGCVGGSVQVGHKWHGE